MRLRFLLILLLALLVALPPVMAATAPAPLYCPPVAFRDYQVLVGYAAIVRVMPNCGKPALIRKINTVSGSREAPLLIPPNKAVQMWVFTHRLTYTLDGKSWKTLGVR